MYGAHPSAPTSSGGGVCRVPPGLLGAELVPTAAGWRAPARELVAEFTHDQKRPPTSSEIYNLRRLAERSNAILRRMTGGHSPSRTDEMDWNTAQGLINFYSVHARGPDNKGDPSMPPRGGPETEALVHAATNAVPSKESLLSAIVNVITAPITAPIRAVAAVTSSIPVLGDITHIVDEAASAPINVASAIASGARLDHVAVNALKSQLKLVKDVAPYAQTVVSLVPGIGSGVAAAVGAGVALAEGQNITEAVKAGVRGALPGGPLVQAGFDAALKVAAGGNVAQAVLEGARAQLSPAAQKAFDVGLAVVTGEKIQTALANGLASMAPAQMQSLVAAGQKALASTPGLSEAIKSVAPGAATQGFQIAAGLLSQTGINEKALTAARNALTAEVRQGFDAALKTQAPHVAWLSNVTNTPAATALEPPKRAAPAGPAAQALEPPKKTKAGPLPQALEPPKRPTVYGPYPHAGALSDPPASTSADVHSPTRTATEVRSPTSTSTEVRSPTSTSTEAYTQGNFTVTVTGGAGAGETNVNIEAPPLNRQNSAHSKGAPKNAHENVNINAPRPKGPTAQENTSVNAPTAGNGVSGWGLGGEEAWGPAITDMPQHMTWAGRSAVNGSHGRPRKVQGPDGTTYLFAIENGTLTARPAIGI